MTEQRRLAAILVADVVGYSKLVGSDEAGTLAQLQALRTDLIEPQIVKHAGRLFKSVGDGFLIEFSSAVQAVSCAKAIQDANSRGHLPMRIGIHVGDVVVQGDDLMGDGVNVAARVEGIAEPGGIAITRAVHEQVRDKLDLGFLDKGEIELKNIQRPVQVFVIAGAKVGSQATALPLPDKPSIAVLPFQNMSGDPEQEYFVDGLVEEITTALSRFKSLFVIARNSSFIYKGKAVDIKRVGQELGVRYVLEGGVRKAGTRLRITAQLIEADTSTHVWSERYDGELQDIFDLQDRITSSVAGTIEPTIQEVEISRRLRRRGGNLGAYDHYLRALALFNSFTQTSVEGMLRHTRRAISLDPLFAPAYMIAARAHIQRLIQGWVVDLQRERTETLDLVERGLQADRHDPLMLGTAGHCFAWFGHDIGKGLAYIDEALEINPNNAHGFLQSGVVRTRAGQLEKAREHLERALRLSPRDVRGYAYFQAMALIDLLAERTQEAREWALRAVQHNANYAPGWYVLAASEGILGEKAKTKDAVDRLVALDPKFSISGLLERLPTKGPEVMKPLVDGLRLAGLPE
ncbi:adenylate cyclase [Rhodospirillales bacterium URHD0017]|nr:adenylate cyclase [Rhodospirillales bacterium URHD0017]